MTENLTRNLTNLLESARDATLEAASLASSNLVQEQSGINLNISAEELARLLDNRSEKDKLVGLKTMVTLMSLGRHDDEYFLAFFPKVIKNVTSTNATVKKLVYVYLLRFNHLSPDTALLSINAIQKATLDKDPVMRSLAIRTLSGIQIAAIVPILALSVKKCATDPSPLVRASTAVAICKCYRLEVAFNGAKSAVVKQLLAHLKDLLADGDTKVLNSAIVTFHQIQGSNYAMLHGYFHHLVARLPDLESWTQALLVDILTNYCRLYCAKPTDDTFSDTLKFLAALKPLTYSSATDVVLAISKAYISLGTSEIVKESRLHLSLVKFLKGSDPGTVYLLLQQLCVISQIDPSIIQGSIRHFYLSPLEPKAISIVKLKILRNLIDTSNCDTSLKELKYYVKKSVNLAVQVESVRVITRVITRLADAELNSKVLKWCYSQINQRSVNGKIVDEILVCTRHIISLNPAQHVQSLLQLTSKLLFASNNFNSSAKTSIIWLLGEFLNKDLISVHEYFPDILRVLISQNFYYLDPHGENARLETLNLASKSWCKELYQWKSDHESLVQAEDKSLLLEAVKQLVENSKIFKLFSYCLYLCKFDESLDIRNEARKFGALLPWLDLNDVDNYDVQELIEKVMVNLDLATLMLQTEKPHSLIGPETGNSLNQILKYDQSLDPFVRYYDVVELWSTRPLSSSVREKEVPITDYDKKVTALSSKAAPTSASRYAGFGNQQWRNPDPVNAVPVLSPSTVPAATNGGKKYKLQSLDEFLGSEDEESGEDVSGEEEEDSGSEEEDESSEEEDDEDEDEDSDDSGRQLMSR